YAAKSGKEIALIEKNDYLGGCIKSFKPYADSDFFTELGAHTIYSSYATMIEALKEMNMESSILPQTKAKYLFVENSKISSIYSRLHPLDLLTHVFKASKYVKNKMTVKDYYSAIVGKKNYDDLVGPMTSAVICQTSDNVAADLLLKKRPKDKSLPRSFSIAGGLSTYINNAVAKKNVEVRLSTTVTGITKDSDGYTVSLYKDEVLRGKQLVIATDALTAGKLLNPISQKLSELLSQLPHHPSYALGLSAEVSKIGVPPFSYMIAKNMPFRSGVSRDVVPHNKYRGVTFHLKENAGHDVAKSMLSLSGDAVEARESYILPELRLGHHEWKAEVEKLATEIPNFHLLGNFFEGLSMEDCAIRAKEEALRATR
ncbi:MAG: FAD-dependent oxidoreductase, partial [Deferribacteraceae bacterium]|nr:FAD-dependent oxidoreductase [Deferribacteraceae bacterium]